jgi:hypothetical protein
MFILLRRIERWLHQHVFKVGWLVTHNYQTTTILYYTIFLPGVFLHELVYWLVAGALGVHAGRSIKWPEQQEIGELKLNFVQISNRAGVYRKAIISAAPMILGLVFIWYIAANVFDIMAVVSIMSSGDLRQVAFAIDLLLGAPLFWLWIYIIFTVANTMYPTIPKDLRGWRTILIGIAALIFAIVLLGIGGEVFDVLQTPLSSLIAVLQIILALIIGVDILVVLVLGTIEYTIERITGHSATIQGGKLVTMTRQEAIDDRQKERERERRRVERQRNRAATVGPSSVYLLPFSMPGAPGEEAITQVVEEPTETPVIEKDEEQKDIATPMPLFGGLAERTSGISTEEVPSEEDKERRESISARIKTPEGRSPVPAPKTKPSEKEEKAAQKIAKPSQPSLIGDDDKQEDTAKSPAPRFAKSVAAAKSDDTSAEKPKPPIASRFGKPLSQAKPDESVEDIDDDKQEDRPKSPAASRFASSPSRPKISQPSLLEDDDDDKQEDTVKSPAASRFPSPFARPKPTAINEEKNSEGDEVEERPSVVVGRPATASRLTELDDEDEVADEDEVIAARPEDLVPRTTRFGLKKPSSEEDTDEKPQSKRFSASPFSRPTGDENKRPAASFGASRFGAPKPIADEENDDDEELDASILRQGRGKDAISSLFGRLDDDSDENEDESVGSSLGNFRRPTISSSTSRFGSSRPVPKPISDSIDDDEIIDDDAELAYEDIDDEYLDDDEYFDENYDDD